MLGGCRDDTTVSKAVQQQEIADHPGAAQDTACGYPPRSPGGGQQGAS